MKWEWAVGEVILLVLALYELWSLRRYDKANPEAEQTDRPKEPLV
jgi:hypothetical protein